MFERFTERARQVVVFAQDEARGLKTARIDTEHLLLGLMRVKGGVAARVLEQLGLEIDEVRGRIPEGSDEVVGQIPFTADAKVTLELALREALALGHTHIGSEHILLGLARLRRGTAAEILQAHDVDSERIRAAVVEMVGPQPTPVERPPTPGYEVRELAGPPDTWADQLNAWAAQGWSLHTIVENEGRRVAVLVRRD